MQKTKDIIRQVKKIEIGTKKLVDGFISGNYRSVFKGQGIEFSDIRDYRPGDDVRSIDWNVTARFNQPFIKEFIEERDLRIYFAFDFSASGSFGNFVEKRFRAIELSASLMFSAIRNNDNVGLFIFTNTVETFIPARKGKKHVLKLISALVSHKSRSKMTNIKKSLSHIANVVKRRAVIFIVSDFYSDDFSKALNLLKKKHDVVALRVNDSREISIPDVGLIDLEDEETGEQLLVDTSDEEFRKSYIKVLSKKEDELKTLFRKNKIDSIQLFTDEKYDVPLRKFFKLRQKGGVS